MARLRYRKSVKLPGGFRVNVSTKGVGYSWGVKGARITKRVDGRTTFTGSIPGTGLSMQQTLSTKRKQKAGTFIGRHTSTQSPILNATQVPTRRPDYWTGFVGNLFIPGIGMAHIQAPGWALIWAAVAIIGAFFISPWMYFLSVIGCFFHYRNLYNKNQGVNILTSKSTAGLPTISTNLPRNTINKAVINTYPPPGIGIELGKPSTLTQALIDANLFFDASIDIDNLQIGEFSHLVSLDIFLPGCVASQEVINKAILEYDDTNSGIARYLFFIVLEAMDKIRMNNLEGSTIAFYLNTEVFLGGSETFIIQIDPSAYILVMTPADARALKLDVS